LIVEAARDLFVRRGVDAVSLRDIAATAGISHAAIRRHFSSYASIIIATLEDVGGRETEPFEDLDSFIDHVRTLESDAFAPRLFAILAASASDPIHPAHALLQRLQRTRLRALDQLLGWLSRSGSAAPRFDARALLAIWEGQSLVALYDQAQPSPSQLLTYIFKPATTARQRVDETDPLGLAILAPAGHAGYAAGRETRAQILDAAVALFAQRGYHGTTLQQLADQIGTVKSTLLHYFASKEDLLAAVLQYRDAQLAVNERDPHEDPVETLHQLGDDARRDSIDEPGLIALYATLSSEASAREHPAHEYFAERYHNTIAYFNNLIERVDSMGRIRLERDPQLEGSVLVAMWDGLQFQWLEEGGSVVIEDRLRAFVDDLVC
jgi:AcrR family transcriptional regulator